MANNGRKCDTAAERNRQIYSHRAECVVADLEFNHARSAAASSSIMPIGNASGLTVALVLLAIRLCDLREEEDVGEEKLTVGGFD